MIVEIVALAGIMEVVSSVVTGWWWRRMRQRMGADDDIQEEDMRLMVGRHASVLLGTYLYIGWLDRLYYRCPHTFAGATDG